MLLVYVTIAVLIVVRESCLWCFLPRAFDVEMLYIAQVLGIPIAEVAVNWKEIQGMAKTVSFFA